MALIDQALELPAKQQAAALEAARRSINEASEASLLGTNELKWASPGWLIPRPRLAGRLALAPWAEMRHAWHRLTGGYDTAVFTGARLQPAGAGKP